MPVAVAPEPQWLLAAYDVEKQASRDFALSGIKAWGQEAVDAALATPPPVVPESVRRLSEALTLCIGLIEDEPVGGQTAEERSDRDARIENILRVAEWALTATPSGRADTPSGGGGTVRSSDSLRRS